MHTNILWIMADQMRGDCLSCAGHPWVRTPHLDALAARGARFANTFVQAPLCGPSRTSWFSGRYARRHGTWWNGIPHHPGIATLPAHLRRQGWRTIQIGKLHFYPQELDHGFDHREVHEECLPDRLNAYHAFLRSQDPSAAPPTDQTRWAEDRPRHADVGVCTMPEELEETRWVADRTLAVLAEQREPFFCFASFLRPHSPYNPLERHLRPYRGLAIEPPPFSRSEWDAMPSRQRELARILHFDALGPADWVEIRRHYYALISQVDEQVGRIVDGLVRLGLADSTLVAFCSDHGEFAGEHGVGHKMGLWDGSLHVPLILHDPRGRVTPGVRRSLVESIDLAPTLCQLAGIPVPEGMDGRSLEPLLADPDAHHRDRIHAEYVHYLFMHGSEAHASACRDCNSTCVRTRYWKYIHYPGEEGELYHLATDPLERNNVIRDHAATAVVSDLRGMLLDWQTGSSRVAYEPAQPGNPYFEYAFASTSWPPTSLFERSAATVDLSQAVGA